MIQHAVLVNMLQQFLSGHWWHLKARNTFLILSGIASPLIYMTDSCGMFYLWSSCLDLPFPCVISQHVKEQTKHKRYARYCYGTSLESEKLFNLDTRFTHCFKIIRESIFVCVCCGTVSVSSSRNTHIKYTDTHTVRLLCQAEAIS